MRGTLILLSQRVIRDAYGVEVDSLDPAYIEFFAREGLFPDPVVLVPVPNDVGHARELIVRTKPDAVILTGGNNVDPRTFGSDMQLDDCAPRRDETERVLFAHALENALPVIGICRGFQVINVLLRGSLSLGVDGHGGGGRHSCTYAGDSYTVNSYHDHAVRVRDLADGLAPLVLDDGGEIIEAFGGRRRGARGETPVLGVQWHPERPGSSRELFRRLVREHLPGGFPTCRR